MCVSLAADTLGLTACEDHNSAVRAHNDCSWHLKYSHLDQQLLPNGRFELYQPEDLSEAKEGCYEVDSKTAIS